VRLDNSSERFHWPVQATFVKTNNTRAIFNNHVIRIANLSIVTSFRSRHSWVPEWKLFKLRYELGRKWNEVAVYCGNQTQHTATVRTSQETHYASATESNRLMLLGKQSLFTVRTIRNTQIQCVGRMWDFYYVEVGSYCLCVLVVRVPGFRSRGSGSIPGATKFFWEIAGIEWGPLSFVSTIEELLERKSSGSGLENREYGRRDPSRWPHGITLYPQKLALTSSTSGGRSVGIVSSRTQTTEFAVFVEVGGT
jgi:hypothetical protein